MEGICSAVKAVELGGRGIRDIEPHQVVLLLSGSRPDEALRWCAAYSQPATLVESIAPTRSSEARSRSLLAIAGDVHSKGIISLVQIVTVLVVERGPSSAEIGSELAPCRRIRVEEH